MALDEFMLSRRSFLNTATASLLAGCRPYQDSIQSVEQQLRKVAVFAGHVEVPNPPNGQGSQSASEIPEYKFNDELLRHFELLPNPSSSYTTKYARENIPIGERPTLAQRLGSEVYIEIHHDSAQQQDIDKLRQGEQTEERWREVSGFSVIYHPNNQYSSESLRLAQLIANELYQSGFRPNLYHNKNIPGERRPLVDGNRAIYTGREDVIEKNAMPAVIVEAGVIVNPFEEKILRQLETQRKISESIDKALARYFAENGRAQR